MDQETQKLITEKYRQLPFDIKKAIVSSDYEKKLAEIYQKYQLHVDQAGSLELETTMVMLGIIHPADYVQNLVSNAGIPKEKATTIANEVNNKIFLPIRSSLMKMAEEMEKEAEEENKVEENSEVKPVSGIQQIKPANHDLDREQILKEIENHTNSIPENLPTEDTLLPMITGNQTLEKMPLPEDKFSKIVATPTITNITAPQTSPIKKIDPYREQI